jgi:hypothetical protein
VGVVWGVEGGVTAANGCRDEPDGEASMVDPEVAPDGGESSREGSKLLDAPGACIVRDRSVCRAKPCGRIRARRVCGERIGSIGRIQLRLILYQRLISPNANES